MYEEGVSWRPAVVFIFPSDIATIDDSLVFSADLYRIRHWTRLEGPMLGIYGGDTFGLGV